MAEVAIQAAVRSSPNNEKAVEYIASFLNRNLHLHISDGRLFVGQMKCTDNERNIILATTYEYRPRSEKDVREAAQKHDAPMLQGRSSQGEKVKAEMRKRFVGLVVVPGWCIKKIEAED